MTIDEAIKHCYDVASQNKECEKTFQFNMQTAKWLEELKMCRMFRVNKDIKNPLANISGYGCHHCDHKDEYIIELEAENEELKRLLKLAIEDMRSNKVICNICKNSSTACPRFKRDFKCFKWRYANEVMRGLIEDGNELDSMQ